MLKIPKAKIGKPYKSIIHLSADSFTALQRNQYPVTVYQALPKDAWVFITRHLKSGELELYTNGYLTLVVKISMGGPEFFHVDEDEVIREPVNRDGKPQKPR